MAIVVAWPISAWASPEQLQRMPSRAAAEPAWTAAGTELLITPEMSGAALVVKVVPQIVLPPAAAGQPPRPNPITASSAGLMVGRGAPPQTGILPGTDPEFYRLFLGAQQSKDDTFTSLTVAAQVQYIGGAPGAVTPAPTSR